MAIVEQTQFFVYVAGTDVSMRWASRLDWLECSSYSGEVADTCSISLDDKDGQLVLPAKGAAIQIALGPKDDSAEIIFDGIVDDVRSEGARGEGMMLVVDGKTADTKSKQKTKRNKHWDNKTIGEAVIDAGQWAGIMMTVAPRIAALKRKYIVQDYESALHFIERLSRQVGGTFKMIGGVRGVVLDRNSGQTVGGSSVADVVAIRDPSNPARNNLISWKISPLLTRPRFTEIRTRYYDRDEAKYKEKKIEVEGAKNDPQTQTDTLSTYTGADEDDSDQIANSDALESDREKGVGEIRIDGNAAARAGGKIKLTGARPGVDGTYLMDLVTHEFDAAKGWVTTIKVSGRMPAPIAAAAPGTSLSTRKAMRAISCRRSFRNKTAEGYAPWPPVSFPALSVGRAPGIPQRPPERRGGAQSKPETINHELRCGSHRIPRARLGFDGDHPQARRHGDGRAQGDRQEGDLRGHRTGDRRAVVVHCRGRYARGGRLESRWPAPAQR